MVALPVQSIGFAVGQPDSGARLQNPRSGRPGGHRIDPLASLGATFGPSESSAARGRPLCWPASFRLIRQHSR